MKFILFVFFVVALAGWLADASRSLAWRSLAAQFVGGLRAGSSTANSAATLEHAHPITGMSFDHLHRTANAELAQQLYDSS